jgi:hypothetical protein
MSQAGIVHIRRTAARNAARVLSFALAVGAAAGCSTQAWYEGMKFNARNECNRQPPGETESCLRRVNTMTYEEYERNRLGQKP